MARPALFGRLAFRVGNHLRDELQVDLFLLVVASDLADECVGVGTLRGKRKVAALHGNSFRLAGRLNLYYV